ncbi:GNAT family N-acetyltransferase [Kineococcus rhizosphaerae]|uniref:Acetyltransferase (GNAT) family protein n=1 Tax=Kineococcus rhizosphaerae TaxID=559628 RepID=A0A2T0QXY6_9ACTN|nr:GNAT family N-acetyltransferase [Kineococcus rhizosphaerae]PRY11059.1 acetyltransferase (GNAT) family protein [Kineococcus rhizosphaerae]
MTVQPLPVVTWVATGWDDPRVVRLRHLMDAEVGPRYARPDGGPRYHPPGPSASEVAVTWLALGGDEPAATASLRRLAVDGEPVRWEVKRVFVDPAHRRRGLAAEALRRVEQSARDLGVSRLVLQTGNLQPEAVALYERAGWEPVPVYPPYDAVVHSRCYGRDL